MKKLLVILDNGHGVNTKGKRSPDERLMEWKWCRDFVSKLNDAIKKEGFETYILVPEDTDVSLSNRVLRANTVYKNFKRISSDWEIVLISVHVNAAKEPGWSKASGLTVWVSENASKKSRILASLLQVLAKDDGLTGNRWIPAENFYRSNFYICKNTSSPAILVENMFMTNKSDVDFLLSEEGTDRLVQVYIDALKSYYTWLQSQ